MSSDSHSMSTTTERPEADPLPPKIGERGYIPASEPQMIQLPSEEERVLPARHPADRDSEPTPAPATDALPPASTPVSPSNQASSIRKPWKQRLSLGGVSPLTLARILILLIFLAATSAAWGIIIIHFSGAKAIASDPSDNSQQSSNGYDGFNSPTFSSVIIVHVSFTIVILVELLFLERSIFHARAERYLHKNGIARGAANVSMGIAPWNRPPLPTYAAALAEIGVGTGDVEDNMIAIAPPPAYGNTRGSTLLLAGMLRESLIRSMNRSSQQSANSAQRQTTQDISPRELEEGRPSRPISYEASEEADNAKRARELEAALARLESREGNGHP